VYFTFGANGESMIWNDKRTKLAVMLLLAAGIFLRFYFYFGHVYSDDAYYNYLAYTLYKGDFGADYLGYPICLVRVGQSWLTAMAFWLFGTTETAAAVFPMIFSIFNMILVYKITKVITKSEITSLVVLLFTAFYPTEILFASVSFTDLFSTVFIHSGILMLYLAYRDRKFLYSVIAGVLFFVSVLFKINVFYTSLLLSALLLYQLASKRSFNVYIFTALAVLGSGMAAEGLFYYLNEGDYFYRLTAMNTLSGFSSSDFISRGFINDLLENIKAVFLRRNMVFIPLLAVISLYAGRKERMNRIVVYWFSGLLVLYLFFSMSLSSYKPMPLRFTWYLFPLFLPAMILASKLITGMKKGWMGLSLSVYIVFSVYMTAQFRDFFDMDNIGKFNAFLRSEPGMILYTDHFTKYSIDLLDGYPEPLRTRRLNYDKENNIPAGSYAVFHSGHTSEINKQGFDYPEESFFNTGKFRRAGEFGRFIIYQKTGD
jgi:4-amino-4-deoxy-L-arabinose transferase-like glycosyltransferase